MGRLIAVTLGAAVLAVGGAWAAAPGPPGPVALYVSPTGSDSGRCTALAPCASFARAYAVAAPGQTVLIAGGSYPPQTIPFDDTKSGSARVVFRAAQGASVQIQPTGVPYGSALEIEAQHVQVMNMTVGDEWAVVGGADDVEMDNVNAQRLRIGSASNVTVRGGSFGPYLDSSGTGGSHIWADVEGAPDPTNILLDGIKMHDYTIPPGSGYHLDCLTIGGGTNITLTRSRFWNCNGFDAWTKPFPNTCCGTHGLTFVNNVFGPNPGGTPQVVEFACADDGSTLNKILFEYNSVGGEAAVGTVPFPCTIAGSGVIFRANILPEINPANCGKAGFVTAYNVVRQNPCSRTDTKYSDSSFWEKMPVSIGCSRAVGHGDPSHYPQRDFRGFRRPQGGRPDAGAYETRVSKSCKFGRP